MTPKEREAMQQALEALEQWKLCCDPSEAGNWPDEDEAAITALREALAEPVPEGYMKCPACNDRGVIRQHFTELERMLIEDAFEKAVKKPKQATVSGGLCGGCAKKAADGWALYCVECWEQAEQRSDSERMEPVCECRRKTDAVISAEKEL